MRYRVLHRTEYLYPEPVTLCHNEARLSPRASPHQQRLRHDLLIDPSPAVVTRKVSLGGVDPETTRRPARSRLAS